MSSHWPNVPAFPIAIVIIMLWYMGDRSASESLLHKQGYLNLGVEQYSTGV